MLEKMADRDGSLTVQDAVGTNKTASFFFFFILRTFFFFFVFAGKNGGQGWFLDNTGCRRYQQKCNAVH